MKSKALKYTFSVLLSSIIIICICMYIYVDKKKSKKECELLLIANSFVDQSLVNGIEPECIEADVFSVDNISENKDVLGKIIIPKINIEAPIKEGTSASILREAVGHFSNTKYWNGNVCLASHNRGTYAHYFENINELTQNDEIIYQTKLGTRVYIVDKILEVSEKDLSVLDDTKQNYITLITCIKNKPEMRLCVKAVEKV